MDTDNRKQQVKQYALLVISDCPSVPHIYRKKLAHLYWRLIKLFSKGREHDPVFHTEKARYPLAAYLNKPRDKQITTPDIFSWETTPPPNTRTRNNRSVTTYVRWIDLLIKAGLLSQHGTEILVHNIKEDHHV